MICLTGNFRCWITSIWEGRYTDHHCIEGPTCSSQPRPNPCHRQTLQWCHAQVYCHYNL